MELLHTINWISKYYITPIGKTLKSTIPYQLFESYAKKNKKIKISKLGIEQLNKIKFPKQKHILKYLAKAEKYLDIEDLQFISVSYRQICKKLYEKKFVTIENIINEIKQNNSHNINNEKIELNKEQLDIFNDFKQRVTEREKKFILSGIPGSGKTIVYSKIVGEILKKKQQIIILVPEISLIQQTFNRLERVCSAKNIFVVTNINYKQLCLEQLPNVVEKNILCEPVMRNTAPCVAFAAFKIQSENPEANMIIAASDHIIIKEDGSLSYDINYTSSGCHNDNVSINFFSKLKFSDSYNKPEITFVLISRELDQILFNKYC